MFRQACTAFSAFAAVVAAGSAVLAVREEIPVRTVSGAAPESRTPVMSAQALRDELPAGTRIDFCDMALRGWQLGGELCMDMPEAVEEVAATMSRCGFKCRQTVGECERGRMLSEWEGPSGVRCILALTRTTWNRTGFSWGLSK